MESNDSPEIPDRGETSDIPGLPSGDTLRRGTLKTLGCIEVMRKVNVNQVNVK